MAVSVSATDSTRPTEVEGARRVANAKVTFDSSYPTGGEPLTAAMFGLVRLDFVRVHGATEDGRLVRFIPSTSKLQVFQQGAAAGAFTEVANATDLSADHVYVTAVGA